MYYYIFIDIHFKIILRKEISVFHSELQSKHKIKLSLYNLLQKLPLESDNNKRPGEQIVRGNYIV